MSVLSISLFSSGLDILEDDVEVDATACVVPVKFATTSSQTEAKRLSLTDFFVDSDTLHHYTSIETYNKCMLLFNSVWDL